ncbi:MAG: HEAT repeat domain-containing protein [Anaerolineae bacterium]|nr:HEAT repeat domain-containing protein [Anaerolineae bacterium]
MRRFIILLFVLTLIATIGISLILPNSQFVRPILIVTAVWMAIVVLDRTFGLFKPRKRRRVPFSQVAEIERLYFRSIREMLNDFPDTVQVINDLQRILSIDPYYKNAQHYLNRAVILQAQHNETRAAAGMHVGHSRAEFMRLQEQLIDPDAGVRKAVVMELINYGEIAIDPLIALLMDDDSDVRVHAATALGWVGGKDAIQPLLVALTDDNPYVRRYAARALCWVVDATAVDGLVSALGDEDTYVRRYAARALGWSQDNRAVKPLLELLVKDDNSIVREYVETALDDLDISHRSIRRPEQGKEQDTAEVA